MAYFSGGVHPHGCKERTASCAIGVCPEPQQFYLPLDRHIGAPAVPCVQAGERVLRGQIVARAAGRISANVFAPAAGTVRGVVGHISPSGKFKFFPDIHFVASLLLETAGAVERVRIRKIRFLESAGHDTLVHCADRERPVRCLQGIAQLEREKKALQMENDLLKKLQEIERRDAFL